MVLCAQGGLGSGKTLLVSWLAWLSHRDTGIQVFANYPLHCARRLESWSDVFALEHGIAVLDELHVEIDSRQFGRNVEFTSFLLQTRKVGLDLLYTSQNINQVDMRLRNITDVLALCERIGLPGGSQASRVQMFDMSSSRRMTGFVLRHTPELYALYDTFARVYPLRRESGSYGLSST